MRAPNSRAHLAPLPLPPPCSASPSAARLEPACPKPGGAAGRGGGLAHAAASERPRRRRLVRVRHGAPEHGGRGQEAGEAPGEARRVQLPTGAQQTASGARTVWQGVGLCPAEVNVVYARCCETLAPSIRIG